MTTYCAPCLADLALVRDAATAVNGTASCMAHAVLLTHPGDDPQRRRQRLSQLRDTATEKISTAGPEEQVRLELLVEEYSLAAAMESLVPRRRVEDGAGQSRSARKRRGRDTRGERPEPGRPRGEQRPAAEAGASVAESGGGDVAPAQPAAETTPADPAAATAPAQPAAETASAQPAPATAQEPASGAGGADPTSAAGPQSAPGGAVSDGTAERAGAQALEQVGAPSAQSGAPSAEPAATPSQERNAADAGASPHERRPAVPAEDNAPAQAGPVPLSMAGEAAPVSAAPTAHGQD